LSLAEECEEAFDQLQSETELVAVHRDRLGCAHSYALNIL